MARYRQDILGDIQMQERRIASNRKSADLTTSAKTAGICDAVYPSLLRRLGELQAELILSVDRPASTSWTLPDGTTAAPQAIMTRVTPLTDKEVQALEIPAFLHRA